MKNEEKKGRENAAVSGSEAESSDLLAALDQFSQNSAITNAADDSGEMQEKGESPYVLKIEDAQTSTASSEEIKYNHLKFHLTGQAEKETSTVPSIDKMLPALSYPFLNSNLRYDFPVIIKNTNWINSLKDFIDLQANENSLTGDEKGHFQRTLLKLEKIIKELIAKKSIADFREIWKNAAKILLDSQNSKPQNNDNVKSVLNDISESIDPASKILSFASENASQVIQASRLHSWYKQMSKHVSEIEDLVLKLSHIKEAGLSSSSDQYSAEALHETMGKTGEEEVDFDSLSEIVGKSLKQDILPESRLKRIESVLNTLNNWLKILSSSENSEKYLAKLEADTVQKALSLYKKEKDELINLFKAIRIARLEKEHRYDESKHDPFFAGFSALYLAEDEWACLPPVLLFFNASKIKGGDKADLIDILSSNMPVKVVLIVDDLYNSSTVYDESSYAPGWSAVLGKMVLSLNNCFVLQFPLSHAVQLQDEISNGILFHGPTLYSVYDGYTSVKTGIDPYLKSASASESRAFPLFSFNPANGQTWADAFSLEKSSQNESIWPSGKILLKDDDKTNEQLLHFSLADFLTGIDRYHAHFLPVGRSEWHDEMVNITDYIDPDFKNSSTSVPYIAMADEKGTLYRVVVSKTLCNLCLNARNLWRNLQELGGINNSFVTKKVAEEQKILTQKMETELEKIKTNHNADMQRTIEDLTNEIIANIAGGLLSDEMISLTSASSAPAIPKEKPSKKTESTNSEPKAAEEKEKQAVAEEDDEEEMAFNDPYIDTPLCTSCNDCMNVNSQMFGYDENRQAFVKDPKAGTFKELVTAAEKCPVKIIHPGKPLNPNEPGLDELVKIAEKYN